MPEVEVPLSGALSIDQAVAALDRKDKPQDAPQEAASATPKENTDNTDSSEAAPTADDTPAADTPSENENVEATDAPAEGEQPEPPASSEPPPFWDAEGKEVFKQAQRFGELDKEAQQRVVKGLQDAALRAEQTRNSATSKAMQESAEKRKAAEAIEQRLGQYTQALDRLIPQATQTFKNRWEGVDWPATVDQLGPEQA